MVTFVCSGNLTDVVMYTRLLSDMEVYDIAHKCKYPIDAVIVPDVDNTETHGKARVSYLASCPTKGTVIVHHIEFHIQIDVANDAPHTSYGQYQSPGI